jgi:hypothetical protein
MLFPWKYEVNSHANVSTNPKIKKTTNKTRRIPTATKPVPSSTSNVATSMEESDKEKFLSTPDAPGFLMIALACVKIWLA